MNTHLQIMPIEESEYGQAVLEYHLLCLRQVLCENAPIDFTFALMSDPLESFPSDRDATVSCITIACFA